METNGKMTDKEFKSLPILLPAPVVAGRDLDFQFFSIEIEENSLYSAMNKMYYAIANNRDNAIENFNILFPKVKIKSVRRLG